MARRTTPSSGRAAKAKRSTKGAANREICETFAAQFDPPLGVVGTENVDGKPSPGAVMCAYWDGAQGMGVTCIVHKQIVRAYLECVGDRDTAERAGQLLAKALGALKADQQ
jgi:hypothetical protein